jgi:hypothetical protein
MQPIEDDVEQTLMAKGAEMMILCIEECSSDRKETLASLQMGLQLQLETDDRILREVAAACDGANVDRDGDQEPEKNFVSCLNL